MTWLPATWLLMPIVETSGRSSVRGGSHKGSEEQCMRQLNGKTGSRVRWNAKFVSLRHFKCFRCKVELCKCDMRLEAMLPHKGSMKLPRYLQIFSISSVSASIGNVHLQIQNNIIRAGLVTFFDRPDLCFAPKDVLSWIGPRRTDRTVTVRQRSRAPAAVGHTRLSRSTTTCSRRDLHSLASS